MRKLSEAATQMLLRSGWFIGRDVSSLVDEWELQLNAYGYDIFPFAREVLNELGGVFIDQHPGSKQMSGLLPIVFNPTNVLGAGEDSWMTKELFDILAEQLGANVYPIGEFLDSHYLMAISDDGKIFALLDYAQMIGRDLEEALENIVIGIVSHELDLPL